ncbi:MAG: T9SS type A sorting domain-containing protein [Bacteroidetes bacterium]|nr:T9SS type A sorting domain-containing protein [Bacteroidota bacterium]
MTSIKGIFLTVLGLLVFSVLISGIAFCSPKAETHPCLLFGPENIPVLAQRLGDDHLSDEMFESALEACLRGLRSDESIDWLMSWVAHVEETGIFSDTGTYRWNPDYAYVCDFQWNYMTPDEQSRTKTVMINMSTDIYNESLVSSQWYYAAEHINNWAISHMTDYYIQRMLYPALMFPSEPQSVLSQTRAIEILRNWFDRCPGAITGGSGMMIDETLTSPNGYGLWDLENFSPLLAALARNTSFNPYTYAGNLFHNEGIYRTYVLSFWEQDSDVHTFFSKAGYVGAGHGEGHAIVYYYNTNLLQLASAYNDPVIAWHYYSNPSPCRRGDYDDFLADWNTMPPPIGWLNWHHLLYWGTVEPISPSDAGWPLSKFFDGAGVAVMRKSWNKHDGLVWFRAGYGGSHYQPCQGTVIFHSNDTVILGNGGGQNYSPLSQMNNVLLVDGNGQVSPYPSLPAQRKAYGTMIRIDDDTYLARLDSAYCLNPTTVFWTRRVHYERSRDILEINDSVSTDDGSVHNLSFNWVTNPYILANDKILLPDGYIMMIRSSSAMTCQSVMVQPGSPEEVFNTLLVSCQSQSLKVNWYIGRNEADLENYINTGGYITDVKKEMHPADFALTQNYPNPFNPNTVISYKLKVKSDVKIIIYDILGREIVVLVNEVKNAGNYKVEWNGANSAGKLVGSGVYFYQLKTNSSFTDTKRMVLLK